MARSRSRMMIGAYTCLFTALLILGANTASAQFDETFVFDDKLAVKLELNGVAITQATEQNPIPIDMDAPMDIYLQVNNTHTAALNMSGTIWFYYQGIALFPIEVRDPASNSSWVLVPEDASIPPVIAQLDLGSLISLGPLNLATGVLEASLDFNYHVIGESEIHTLSSHFFLSIMSDPISVITSVAGIATTVATAGAIYGAGTGFYSLFDGIQTAHKVRSIQKKASEIRSLPNLTVLGALPALFALVAGMTKLKKKKKGDEEEEEEKADMITEFRLRQRLREAAPEAWPMDKCPHCKRNWSKKRSDCKKCKIDESEARRQYAELLVSKTTRALRVFNKGRSLSIRKLAKKTKSTDYNAGVIGAAMVDTDLTEIQKIATPFKSFIMNIAGLAFVVLTWQQLLGGAASQWQTTLTIVGAALSLAVIVALYFARKIQVRELESKIQITPASTEAVTEPAEGMPSPDDIEVMRGCEMVGGSFEYKVKIVNGSDSVINNVTVTIVAYPEDCIELTGDTMKKLARIEPSGFRSPQFTFIPTKDCVEGQILSSVSFVDHRNNLEVVEVEPYLIRSVCDLLRPMEASLEEFDELLHVMTASSEERIISNNPEAVFARASAYLPERNFYVIDSASDMGDEGFHGTIRALAEGKYTSKRVAIRITVAGQADGSSAQVTVEALADDPAMLPTTIKEIMDGVT